MSKKLSRFIVAALFTATGQASFAVDTFQGTIWSLTYSGSPLFDVDPIHETFRISLDVNTSGYTGTGSFLDQVAIKVSPSFFAKSLFNAPNGPGDWLLMDGGISAGGCSGAGSGFLCADSLVVLNGGKGVSLSGGPYEWIFDVTVDNGKLFTGLLESSVKGRFVNSDGAKVGALVSEDITLMTPIPEPEIYAMMGIGLALMGFVARRRKGQASAA